MPRRTRTVAALAAACVPLALLPSLADSATAAEKRPGLSRELSSGLRSVMYVGNNWSGTASIVDARTMKVLKRGIDLIPDKEQELADIQQDPERLAFFLVIQQGPGEGHNQYVDDMFTTTDGRYLAVSRPSFADVVWVDVAKATAGRPDSIVHEEQMDGHRTDHMGLSPDGKRLLVSDSTSRAVHEFSMVNETLPDGRTITMGQRLRTFESGETPHESNYSRDGSTVFHASIGRVYTPGDELHSGPVKIGPIDDAIKGDRWFQMVRNRDFSVTHRWNMGKELEEAGYPGMSPAVRPMAVAPGERFIYYQVSYFHGLVEFDTQASDLDGRVTYTAGGLPEPRVGAVRRVVPLPNRVPTMPLTQYVNDSAHHGLSINSAGTTLCVAGTMDDYAALVDRRTMRTRIYDQKTTGHSYAKPYWTTEGPGDRCWISLSEADAVAVLDVRTGKELAYFPVGDHPQRIRHGWVREKLVRSWTGPTTPVTPGESNPLAEPLKAEAELSDLVHEQVLGAVPATPPAVPTSAAAAPRTERPAVTDRDVSLASAVASDDRTPYAALGLAGLLALTALGRRRARARS